MVDYFQAVFLAIIQGITEWLPVSSSAHLALIQQFMGISPPVFFDIMLHMGTLLAVVIYFRNDLFALFTGFITFNPKNPQFQYCMFIIAASIPTAIIGFTLHDVFASMFSNLTAIAVALIITGIALYSTKYVAPTTNKTGVISLPSALLIGIAQGFAVAPGISRSGITIASGMLAGVNRETAARFSFLLSIPALIGAGIFEFRVLSSESWEVIAGPSIVGAAIAAVVGYLSIGFLLDIIRKGYFSVFAYYCWLLAFIILVAGML